MTVPVVVHESEGVVAVDKPHGWLTIPGRHAESDPRPVLARRLADRMGGKLWIVHRLDREVSGLLLFARNPDVHRLLSGWFERHEVVKRYEAWTEGEFPDAAESGGSWEGWLIRGRRRVHEASEPARGKWVRTQAHCRGRVMHEGAKLLRWELLPETGRTHQLRCQCSARGFPIAGDGLYGSHVSFRPDAIALRAVSLEFHRLPPSSREEVGLPLSLRVEGLS
jgi:tRNA pseudouridine32 synthase/23S rRNA pseudouridine746 synthase